MITTVAESLDTGHHEAACSLCKVLEEEGATDKARGGAVMAL